MFVAGVSVSMFHGNAGPGRLGDIQWRAVAAEHFHWRPLRQDRDGRRRVWCEITRRVNKFSVNNCEHGFDAFDFFFRHGKVIVRECDEVRQLTRSNCALLSALT